MTYASGQTVEASDYNTLAAQINAVFGTGTGDSGYGGNSTNTGVTDLPTINVGDTIQSFTSSPGSPDEWKNLRNAFTDCAAHQNTVLTETPPSDTLLDDGDIVTFFSTLNSAVNSSDLATNRLNVNPIHLALSTILTDIRATPWSSFLRHEFTVTFTDTDAARHFFNTGGDLRVSASRTGGSATTQNTEWSTLLSTNSPLIFDRNDYFSNLTSLFTTFQSVSSGGLYSANTWIIRAKKDNAAGPNGGNGSIIRFQSDFLDGHTNIFFDTVDGTLTSTLEQRKSVGVFPIPTPATSTITVLSSGI